MTPIETPPGGGWGDSPRNRPVVTEETTYRLVVETDSYSGNFEREMTAAATGVIGECGVGDNELEEFFDAAAAMGYEGVDIDAAFPEDVTSPFESLMVHVSDDEGCSRPCTIEQNAAHVYNNVAMFMFQRPATKDMAFIAQRIHAFAERKKIKILGIKFIKRVTTKTDTVVETL